MRRRTRPSRAPLRSRPSRLVALGVAVGQLLVAVAAWADAAEGRPDARPHVERDGTRLHHAHVESDCALCAVQHIDSSSPPRPMILAHAGAAPVAPLAPPATVVARYGRGRRLSRA